MKIERLYLSLTALGILCPTLILYRGLRLINWNWNTALLDLFGFLSSPFGLIVMSWLLITGSALSIFAIYESVVRRDYYLLWAIPVTILLSSGAGLPFYLYLRSPKKDQ